MFEKPRKSYETTATMSGVLDSGRRVHVLHVDDEPDYRLLVEEAAQRANSSLVLHGQDGYLPAIEYLSGEGVFAHRRQYPLPAFVLLDYSLNGHTGVDLLRWLRFHSGLPSLPAVMFSDSDRVEQVALCYREGARHYLRKPHTFDGLTRLLQVLAHSFSSDPPCHDLLLALREYRPKP